MTPPEMSPAALALYEAARRMADEHGWILRRVFEALPEWSEEAEREVYHTAIRRSVWDRRVDFLDGARYQLRMDMLSNAAARLYWQALQCVDDSGRMWPQDFRVLPAWGARAEDELRQQACLFPQRKWDGERWAECVELVRPSFERLAAYLRQQGGEP